MSGSRTSSRTRSGWGRGERLLAGRGARHLEPLVAKAFDERLGDRVFVFDEQHLQFIWCPLGQPRHREKATYGLRVVQSAPDGADAWACNRDHAPSEA